MDGLDQKLDSILSDPESMRKIMDLANSLGLTSSEAAPAQEPAGSSVPTQSAGPQATFPLSNLGAVLSSISGQGAAVDDQQMALLKALRPYLRPERQDRLDHALQAARMVKTAKLAMKQFMPRGDQHV